MIGDCNPHEIGYTTEAIFWYDEAIKLGDMGVQVRLATNMLSD